VIPIACYRLGGHSEVHGVAGKTGAIGMAELAETTVPGDQCPTNSRVMNGGDTSNHTFAENHVSIQ